MDSLVSQYVVNQSDYNEFIRLSLEERQLEKKLKEIKHKKAIKANKILCAWQKYEKSKVTLDNGITLYRKHEYLLVPTRPEDAIVEELEMLGMNEFVDKKLNLRELRRQASKMDELPPELEGLFSPYPKDTLIARIPSSCMVSGVDGQPVFPAV